MKNFACKTIQAAQPKDQIAWMHIERMLINTGKQISHEIRATLPGITTKKETINMTSLSTKNVNNKNKNKNGCKLNYKVMVVYSIQRNPSLLNECQVSKIK